MIVRIGQDRARLINQMIKYDGKLFIDQVIDDTKVISNTRTTLYFLLDRRELRMLRCWVLFMFSSLCSHIWQFVHINLRYGERDNQILSFLIKVNK